ncbi:MAG: Spy/CpxP family protein refolding chaperone [Pyrinomonadaceae bacterium]
MRLTRKRIIGGALAFAAAFTLSVAAFAQHGPGGPGGHHGPGGPDGPGGPGGSLLGHFSQVLNLTDAQKTQIKQLEDNFKESTQGLREQLEKAGPGGPFDALKDGAFDEASVRAAAQARANLHVELEVAHAKFFSQVYAVLTAEQRAKLAELHKQMEEHHRQGPPPPPPGAEDGGR